MGALIAACTDCLATKDYDSISMSQIAKRAGCSVGAIYTRFGEKESLLYHAIASRLKVMQAAPLEMVGYSLFPSKSGGPRAQHAIRQIVCQLTERKSAGAIRASVKLAAVHSGMAVSLENFREKLTDKAVAQLSESDDCPSATAIRIVMQIVIATVIDAILHSRPGPMRAGSKRMADALTNMALGYLGLATEASWAGDEADDEDVREDDTETDEPPQLGEGEIAIYDPDHRTYRGVSKTITKSRRSGNSSRLNESHTASQTPKYSPSRAAKSQAETVAAQEPITLNPSANEIGAPIRKHRII